MDQPHDSGTTAKGEDWSPVLVALYEEHYAMLVRSARRLVDSRAVAEEVVQEAFIRFHTSSNLPAAGKELSYLHSIVLNGARGRLRRRRVAERWRPEDPTRVEDPEDRAIERLIDAELRAAIQQLPERQREVLALRHIAMLSEQETAELLAISPGAVKSHAARGRSSLRASVQIL